MCDLDDSPSRKFIVGLGNPGRQYAGTRHNVGFDVLNILRQRWGLGDGSNAFEGLRWDARRSGPDGESRKVTLLAPMTYMNCSGRSVRKMLDFYKASASDVLVVLDCMAIPLGRLRARPDGSAAGHNGLQDILQHCGTNAVARLRIGIGGPPGRMDAKDFVLQTFRSDEKENIEVTLQWAADAVEAWLDKGMTPVMETYNRNPQE